MGRMLDALKALDSRTPADAPAPIPPQRPTAQALPSATPAPTADRISERVASEQPAELPITSTTQDEADWSEVNWDRVLDDATALVDDAVEMFGLPPLVLEDPLEVAPLPTSIAPLVTTAPTVLAPLPPLPTVARPMAAQSTAAKPAATKPAAMYSVASQPVVAPPPAAIPPRRQPRHAPSFDTCTLPITGEPAEYYLETAARICDQGSNNYSNVLLFVSADHGSDATFSMPDLAHAFALQLAGDVLLIDGDLRQGRLTRQVSRPGPGMVEAMLGQAQWPDLIHPTNIAQIDFVARGSGQVPTFERPQFGWSALRPLYRSVLIGPANQAEPETLWLAARCDAVYFVLSRLHTRRSNATAAVNALRAGGANVAGCIVVND